MWSFSFIVYKKHNMKIRNLNRIVLTLATVAVVIGGLVEIAEAEAKNWQSVDLRPGLDQNARGLGVAEMAAAIAENRPHRASGDVALHVLEVMHAVHLASESGRHVELQTRCDRPATMPPDCPLAPRD